MSEGIGWLDAAAFSGLCALAVVAFLAKYVLSKPQGSPDMARLSEEIQKGARAFLSREYKYVAVFVVVIFVLLAVGIRWETSVAFLAGAVASACAGFLGMAIATRANSRTTAAAETGGVQSALDVAISGGAVMGLGVVGIALIGLVVVYWLFNGQAEIVNGYAMGASLVALFARSGAGSSAR